MSNKLDLVNSVQKELETNSKAEADRAVSAVIKQMGLAIRKGKILQLIGFGTFKVVLRKARIGVNPKTGAKIKIKASKSVKFIPGKALKSKL